jgi:hypothetical protein
MSSYSSFAEKRQMSSDYETINEALTLVLMSLFLFYFKLLTLKKFSEVILK